MGGASFDKAGFLKGIALSKPFLEFAALEDVHHRAERIAEIAKSMAPEGSAEEGDPHPGAMREDIGIKGEGIDANGPFVDVGTTEPYGLFQEFGTEHNAPHPFMRPAIAAESGLGQVSTHIRLAPRSAASQAGSAAAMRAAARKAKGGKK